MKFKLNKKFKPTLKFSPRDFWNLDITLAFIISGSLKEFKKRAIGNYPASMSHKAWRGILDQMILAFDLIIKSNDAILSDDEEVKVDQGLKLFSDYYRALWT